MMENEDAEVVSRIEERKKEKEEQEDGVERR